MLLSRFLKDRNGNIVPMFAAALIPVVGLVGAAIDYSRASSIRSEMQAALDATALMLSKEAADLSSTQLQNKATAYFQAVFNRQEAKGVIITPTFKTANSTSTIKVTATGSVDTTFTRILGHSKMDLGSGSEVSWGVKKLELALALDNTGSMAQSNKMTELKKAAKSLLDTLKKASKKDGDIKVAIIPFTTDVNVGVGNVNATWLDWTAWDAANPVSGGGGGLVDLGGGKWCFNGWVWNGSQLSYVGSCGGGGSVSHSTWNGCVMDRDQDNDVADTAPVAGVKSTLFPAHQASVCPVPLQPLTSVWTLLDAKIDSMVPVGMTNVTIGLAWAWHALTSSAPLTEGAAPAPDLDKVIVLLTDGDNTQNRFGSNQADIDARTKKACDNVKAANITLYTVRVIQGNASLLKGCASKPEYYYDVQNASQLNAVFKQISDNLASLRISK